MTIFAKATVLVLEHDTGLRSLARRVLAGQAYHVLEARDGDEALDLVGSEAGDVDLVICDVDAPRLRARALVAAIQMTKPDARIVFSSARSDAQLLRSGFDLGIDTLLKRPFNGSGLMAVVRAALLSAPTVSRDATLV